jgi:hypothetical protein
MRESTEYAPGPRIETIPQPTIEVVNRKPSPPAYTKTATPRSTESREKQGVNRPRHKKDADRTNTGMIQDGIPNARPPIALIIVAAATNTRNTKRATPTRPVGNMENSLCTQEG